MERGAEWVVPFLGVLYAGMAYVPLDPALPRRLGHIVEAAGLRTVLARGRLPGALPVGEGRPRRERQGCPVHPGVVPVSEAPGVPAVHSGAAASAAGGGAGGAGGGGRGKEEGGGSGECAESCEGQRKRGPCYILFTSGSTGASPSKSERHHFFPHSVVDYLFCPLLVGFLVFLPPDPLLILFLACCRAVVVVVVVVVVVAVQGRGGACTRACSDMCHAYRASCRAPPDVRCQLAAMSLRPARHGALPGLRQRRGSGPCAPRRSY